MTRLTRRIPSGWWFLAPSAVILGEFTVWPIIQALWMSLHDWSFLSRERPFIGGDNYAALLSDDRFWNALRNTIVYTVATVPVQIVRLLSRPGEQSVGVAAAVAGARFGLMKFGSRMDVFVPMSATVTVTTGRRVQAGLTVIAHLAQEQER